MTLKDWIRPAEEKIDKPVPYQHKKGISRAAKEEIALQWLPLQQLLNGAYHVCGRNFDEEHLQPFLDFILANLQKDTSVQQEMYEKGFEWNDISVTVIDRAREWFTDRIQQTLINDSVKTTSDSDDGSLFG